MENLHIFKRKKTFYIITLLIPLVIFVIVLSLYLKFNANKPLGVTTSIANNFIREKKQISVGSWQIEAEVSNDEIERQKGLSGRNALAENSGMLFVFEKDNVRPIFWMKDMNIPIDIIWIDNGKVVQIDENAEAEPGTSEMSLKRYLPNQEIDYVLEVNAYTSSGNGVKVGDVVGL